MAELRWTRSKLGVGARESTLGKMEAIRGIINWPTSPTSPPGAACQSNLIKQCIHIIVWNRTSQGCCLHYITRTMVLRVQRSPKLTYAPVKRSDWRRASGGFYYYTFLIELETTEWDSKVFVRLCNRTNAYIGKKITAGNNQIPCETAYGSVYRWEYTSVTNNLCCVEHGI